MGPSEEEQGSRLHLTYCRVAMMSVLTVKTKPTLPVTADYLVPWQSELEGRGMWGSSRFPLSCCKVREVTGIAVVLTESTAWGEGLVRWLSG